MSEPGTPGSPEVPRARRVPVWVLAVVVTVAIALTAAITYAATRPDPAASPSPAASSAPSQTPTSPPQAQAPGAPVGGYKIDAGAGGTATAVDGRTPIGYPAQCEGAVAAATNYYTAIAEGLYQDRLTAEQFAALVDQINAGLDPGDGTGSMSAIKDQFATIRQESEAEGIQFTNPVYHPEWGAFLVRSCIDEATAVVDVVGFFEDDLAPGFSAQDSRRVSVSWFNDDWRLVDIADLEEDPAAGVIPIDSIAPLPAEQRKAMIAQGGPGWTEYTNAP